MTTDTKFDRFLMQQRVGESQGAFKTALHRFINSIDAELQARTGDSQLTHLDFEEFNFSFEFEIGSTVAETVSELLIQHNHHQLIC